MWPGRLNIVFVPGGVRWYGHVLRRDDGHVLRKALEFEMKGKRKRGRPVSVYCIFATQIYTFTKFIRDYSLRRQRKPTRNQEAYTDVGSL